MDIQFNEVTWYSKALAVVVFLVCIPIFAFSTGVIVGEIKTQNAETKKMNAENNEPVLAAPVVQNITESSTIFSDEAIEKTLHDCLDQESSNVGTQNCTSSAEKAYEKILEEKFENVIQSLKKDIQDERSSEYAPECEFTNSLCPSVYYEEEIVLLTEAKETWKKYREASCQAAAKEATTGTAAGSYYIGCKLQHTREYIDNLCEENVKGYSRCDKDYSSM